MRACITFLFFFLISLPSFTALPTDADIEPDSSATFIDHLVSQHTEGQWFLAYRYGELESASLNQFTLKRGYITFKNDFTDRLSVRFTQDITLDEEGSDMGNVEMRLKYCYLNIETGDFWIFTDPAFEVGLVHRPWVDYEQKINHYRVQGKMYLERVGLINSADFGITYSGLLGGKMDESYRKHVNSKYPGRYGSISVGIYNGGGYHALEENQSKNIDGRLTLRPFPESFPGLQLTYNISYGYGNTSVAPDFIMNSGFLSYEDRSWTLTLQYHHARGNSSGSYADSLGNAYRNMGYSAFAEYQISQTPIRLFSRFDYFEGPGQGLTNHQRFIAGLAWHFYEDKKLVIDVDAFDRGGDWTWDNRIWEAAIEIRF